MSLACPSVIAAYAPALCRAVDHYCERTSPALDAEPLNALTNIAFLVAAVAAWRLLAAHPRAGARAQIGILIAVTALVGLGSFLFHTVATRWAEWGDVIPILAFMLLYLQLVLARFFAWRLGWRLAGLVSFAAITFALEAAVPGDVLWGGALYLPALLFCATAGAVLLRRRPAAGRAMLGATAVFLASFAARTADAPLCPSFPLGTHFLWHLLNALLLYLLIRIAVVHGPRSAAALA